MAYETVLAEVKQLVPEEQQKLAKEVMAQFKKPRAKKATEEGAEPKPKRVLTDEQKAKMKAGRDAAKAKREADKAAGIVPPKKEKKSKSPLTQKVWEALLDQVKKDLKPEFEDYIKSKLN